MRSFARPASRFDGSSSMASVSTTSAPPPPASASMAKLYMSRGGAAPPSGPRAGTSSVRSDGSVSSAPGGSTASSSSATPPQPGSQESYFRFTDKHQELLLAQSRRNAAGLVIDALYDPAKWRFLAELKATSSLQDAAFTSNESASKSRFVTPPQQNLEVFELKPQAIDRVACIVPRLASDPQQLAPRSHTLLAKTRVRGKLDEFMAWMTTRRRVVHQGLMQTLHEGHLQHSDVFSGFDAENPQNREELEKFALKYFIVEPTAASLDALKASTVSPHSSHTTSGAASKETAKASSSSSMSSTKRFGFLRRKESSDLNDPVAQQQAQQQSTPETQARVPEERMHFCIGEYSAVRRGIPLQSTAQSDSSRELDPRIGIISYHSVEDPELLQLCNSVAHKTTPRSLSQCTSRTLLQYSGIVAYPVASETDDGADYLEVIIKVSCFDARGLSAQKKASMFTFISAFRSLAHTMLVMRLRASPFLTTTNWVADERRKCCLVCQQRFSSLRRRHHCRLCGEVTCAKCSTVHQVRLVKEAKASLRICLVCIQGVDKPQWKAIEREKATTQQEKQPVHAHEEQPQPSVVEEDTTEEVREDRSSRHSEEPDGESNPIDLMSLSFINRIEKPPHSPTSSATDTSSPVEPLMESHGPAMAKALESDAGLSHTIREFHDSKFQMPFEPTPAAATQLRDLPEDLITLQNLMGHFDNDDEEEDEDDDEEVEELPRVEQVSLPLVSPVPKSVKAISPLMSPVSKPAQVKLYEEEEEERGKSITVERLSDGNESEDEDDDDARLHCLAAYGMLDAKNTVDGVIPEDLTLQTIVKEAAQLMDCAISAISFVDASRDMVCATYSASPLCQVPRGVLPKQYSLTWEVMQRARSKEASEKHSIVVLDAGKDAVLRGNPFVVDAPFVRFMVGAPIRSWNGVIIGAIMVADIQPRTEVSSEHTSALKNYATLIESWLENVRQEISTKSNPKASHAVNLQDRLAEMLNTSYKTNLEVQMRSMQMKQQQPATAASSTPAPAPGAKSSQPIRHVLY